jgi:hypothetical protein
MVAYRKVHLGTGIRFFLRNWTVCLAENLLSEATKSRKRHWAIHSVGQIYGYAFVLVAFFSTVPAWKYPLKD